PARGGDRRRNRLSAPGGRRRGHGGRGSRAAARRAEAASLRRSQPAFDDRALFPGRDRRPLSQDLRSGDGGGGPLVETGQLARSGTGFAPRIFSSLVTKVSS